MTAQLAARRDLRTFRLSYIGSYGSYATLEPSAAGLLAFLAAAVRRPSLAEAAFASQDWHIATAQDIAKSEFLRRWIDVELLLPHLRVAPRDMKVQLAILSTSKEAMAKVTEALAMRSGPGVAAHGIGASRVQATSHAN